MKIFEHETYNCPDCRQTFTDPSDVKGWKCPNCDDTIWIMAVVKGNNYTFERIKAKDIQKDDVIFLDDDNFGIDVKKVKRFCIKVRIYFKGNGNIDENTESFINTIIGIWQPRDET